MCVVQDVENIDEQIYLGDMDSRDSDYQRFIYSPSEKREF